MSNINYQQFNGVDPRRESTAKLIPPGLQTSDSSERYWATAPLVTLSVIKMGLAIVMIILQVVVNGQYFKYISDEDEKKPFIMSYAIVCAAAMLLTGIFGICTSSLKSRCLAFFTTIIYFLGYIASLVCCAVSVALYNQVDGDWIFKGVALSDRVTGGHLSFNATYDSIKIELLVLAAISGINFILSITTSALICRGCCTCCHPRTPVPLYLVRTDRPSPAVEI